MGPTRPQSLSFQSSNCTLELCIGQRTSGIGIKEIALPAHLYTSCSKRVMATFLLLTWSREETHCLLCNKLCQKHTAKTKCHDLNDDCRKFCKCCEIRWQQSSSCHQILCSYLSIIKKNVAQRRNYFSTSMTIFFEDVKAHQYLCSSHSSFFSQKAFLEWHTSTTHVWMFKFVLHDKSLVFKISIKENDFFTLKIASRLHPTE